MQRRKLSGLIAILVVILLLVPSMCFAQEDDLGYQDDLNMEDSEELNTGEDISEDIIQMDCDFKDDADTVEKLEAFVEEYEEQLIFEDNEINNDQVDQKYFEEKYGEDIVLAVEENIEDLNEEAAEGDINITDKGRHLEQVSFH